MAPLIFLVLSGMFGILANGKWRVFENFSIFSALYFSILPIRYLKSFYDVINTIIPNIEQFKGAEIIKLELDAIAIFMQFM